MGGRHPQASAIAGFRCAIDLPSLAYVLLCGSSFAQVLWLADRSYASCDVMSNSACSSCGCQTDLQCLLAAAWRRGTAGPDPRTGDKSKGAGGAGKNVLCGHPQARLGGP